MGKGKRAAFAFVCAVLIIFGMWRISPVRRLQQRPTVGVLQTEACDVVLSVYFKGTVQDRSAKALYLAESATIAEIPVEIGDRVSLGEPLLTAYAEPDAGLLPTMEDNAVSVFRRLSGMETGEMEALYCLSEDGVIIMRSPIDGVVSGITAECDMLLPAGTRCITVSDPDARMICAQVPEAYVQDLGPGMACVITGESFRGREYAGVVDTVMPYATKTQTLTGEGETVVEVWIRIEEPDDALRAGYNARVEIITERREDVVTVPYRAVGQDEKNREYVYVYQDGILHQEWITTGAELEQETEVTKGLEAGALIVSEITEELYDGMEVRAVKA